MAHRVNPPTLFVNGISPASLSGKMFNWLNGVYTLSGTANGYNRYILNPSNSATRVELKVDTSSYGEPYWVFNTRLSGSVLVDVVKGEAAFNNPALACGWYYTNDVLAPYTTITYEPISSYANTKVIVDTNLPGLYVGYYRQSEDTPTQCSRICYAAPGGTTLSFEPTLLDIHGNEVGGWTIVNNSGTQWALYDDTSMPVSSSVSWTYVGTGSVGNGTYASTIITDAYFNYPTLDFVNTLQVNNPYNPFINTLTLMVSSPYLYGSEENTIVQFNLINALVYGNFYEFLYRTDADASEADLYLCSDINSTNNGVVTASDVALPGWLFSTAAGGSFAGCFYTNARGALTLLAGVSSNWQNIGYIPNPAGKNMYVKPVQNATKWERRRIAGAT